MNEAKTVTADVLVGELAEEAAFALYGEAGPAARAELADGTGVVLSTEALLAIYDERGGAALLALDAIAAGAS